MARRITKYIVKRNYNNIRTDTDAFIKLIKKAKSLNENKINIEHTQYNIDNGTETCYNENSFRDSCVISKNPKEE